MLNPSVPALRTASAARLGERDVGETSVGRLLFARAWKEGFARLLMWGPTSEASRRSPGRVKRAPVHVLPGMCLPRMSSGVVDYTDTPQDGTRSGNAELCRSRMIPCKDEGRYTQKVLDPRWNIGDWAGMAAVWCQ